MLTGDEILAWIAVHREKNGADAIQSFVVIDDLALFPPTSCHFDRLGVLLNDRTVRTESSEGFRSNTASDASKCLQNRCDEKYWQHFDGFVKSEAFQPSVNAARAQIIEGQLGVRPLLFNEEQDAVQMCESSSWLADLSIDGRELFQVSSPQKSSSPSMSFKQLSS